MQINIGERIAELKQEERRDLIALSLVQGQLIALEKLAQDIAAAQAQEINTAKVIEQGGDKVEA